jgi:hypothetical protein
MKKIIISMVVVALMAVSLISAAAPVSASGVEINSGTSISDPAVSLSAAEIDRLTFMREEEKLARDVYLTLYNIWNSRVFSNISRSEQRHMDSIKTLLDRYSIADPAENKSRGEFTNPDLQKLYDTLIRQGSVSATEAYKVGVLIEKTDIKDLEESLASTTHDDIITTYSNLMSGSENHLRAFSR